MYKLVYSLDEGKTTLRVYVNRMGNLASILAKYKHRSPVLVSSSWLCIPPDKTRKTEGRHSVYRGEFYA